MLMHVFFTQLFAPKRRKYAFVCIKAEEAGTTYMLVEQDNCYGEDPFDCLRRSYENLKIFGFA